MKILIVSAIYPPHIFGGAEIAARNLTRLLAQRGHEVSVLTMAESTEPEVWNQADQDGIRMFRLHFPRARTANGMHTHRLGWLGRRIWHLQDLFDPRPLKQFFRLLNEVKPDHANIHLLDGIGFPLLWALRRRDMSVTFFTHDLSLACTNGSMSINNHLCDGQCGLCFVVSRVKSMYINSVAKVGFMSAGKSNLDKLKRYVPTVAAHPSRAMRNVPEDITISLPAYKPDPNGKIRVLYVGRIHPGKGLEVILDALAPLAGTFDFHLTVLGRGPQEDELKQRYFDSPWVTFGGFVTQEEVVRATLGHDMLCIPSILAEHYPLAASQALQLGTPVLGTNMGGIAELVRHDETGLLLPVGDVEAWRSAFQRVFTQPKLLQTWRDNALVHASEFAPELIAWNFEDFISKLETQPA